MSDVSRFSDELKNVFVNCLHREPRGEFTSWRKQIAEMRANDSLDAGEVIDLSLSVDELTAARWAFGDAVLLPTDLEGVLINGTPAIKVVDPVPA